MNKSVFALVMLSTLLVSLVSAVNDNGNDLSWGSLRINGDFVEDGDVLAVEEGQTIDIRAGIVAENGADDVEFDAKISGYEYSDYESLDDATELFDVQPGTTKYEELHIRLPDRLEKDEYLLRLRILDRDGAALERNIRLSIEPTRHGVEITDVSFSPGNVVKAGRSLLTTVLLENFGDKDEEDVKVTVSIPQLGVSATEFVDIVGTDNHNVDFEDVPEMFLAIPASAQPGPYNVIVTAQYDDMRETVTKQFTINVQENELLSPAQTGTAGRLVLAVGPQVQTVPAGTQATYGIALSNEGRQTKAYVLEAVSNDWAQVSLSESLVVLEPGKSKVVYVQVTPNAAATPGEHVATVAVKADGSVLESVNLRANVTGAQKTPVSWRNGLEIALIVLVVLLVIIGLIIGFSRLRKDETEEEQTYY